MNEQLKVIISAEIENLKKNIGNAKKEIGSFKDKVNQAKQNVNDDIAKMGKGMAVAAAGIGAATAATATALYKVTTGTAAAADEVDKMSQKIGISRQAYQEWNYICGQSGVEVGVLKNGVKTLTSQMQSAKNGSDSAKAAFNALGLSWEDGTGKLKSQETMMEEAITALSNMKSGTERAKLAQQLFGKAGMELEPILNTGAQGIEELRQRCHDLGLVMSDETVNAGVKLGDTIDDVKGSFGAIVNNIGAQLIPIVQQAADLILAHLPQIQSAVQGAFNIVSSAIGFVVQHKGLFAGIAAAIGVICTAIAAYNVAMGIKAAMDAAEVVSLTGLIAVHAAHAVAVMASLAPYIAITAAIAAVIAIIVVCIKHWDKIKEATKKAFEAVKKTVSTAVDKIVGFFKKIFDWIKTNWVGIGLLLVNPLAGAFKLAYDNCEGFRNKVNTFVSNVKTAIHNGFNAVKNFILTPIRAAKETAVSVFESLKSGIKSKIDAARDAVKSAIDRIKSFFNFKWSLPKLKMPHFSVSGKFSLNPPSIPKFGISWYKLGGVFNKPTLFPYGNGAVGGLGEDGAEAVVPLEKNTQWLDKIAERLAAKSGSTPIVLQVDGKTFAETSIRTINDLTKLRGNLPLKIM